MPTKKKTTQAGYLLVLLGIIALGAAVLAVRNFVYETGGIDKCSHAHIKCPAGSHSVCHTDASGKVAAVCMLDGGCTPQPKNMTCTLEGHVPICNPQTRRWACGKPNCEWLYKQGATPDTPEDRTRWGWYSNALRKDGGRAWCTARYKTSIPHTLSCTLQGSIGCFLAPGACASQKPAAGVRGTPVGPWTKGKNPKGRCVPDTSHRCVSDVDCPMDTPSCDATVATCKKKGVSFTKTCRASRVSSPGKGHGCTSNHTCVPLCGADNDTTSMYAWWCSNVSGQASYPKYPNRHAGIGTWQCTIQQDINTECSERNYKSSLASKLCPDDVQCVRVNGAQPSNEGKYSGRWECPSRFYTRKVFLDPINKDITTGFELTTLYWKGSKDSSCQGGWIPANRVRRCPVVYAAPSLTIDQKITLIPVFPSALQCDNNIQEVNNHKGRLKTFTVNKKTYVTNLLDGNFLACNALKNPIAIVPPTFSTSQKSIQPLNIPTIDFGNGLYITATIPIAKKLHCRGPNSTCTRNTDCCEKMQCNQKKCWPTTTAGPWYWKGKETSS
jgi:hypothetical protein